MTRKKRTPGPWERSHKTYSFRASPEESKRIDVLREHQSIREIVMKSLGLIERDCRAFQRGREVGQDEGFDVGFEEGLHRIPAWCETCGRRIHYDSRRPGVQAILDRSFRNTDVPHINYHMGPNVGTPPPHDRFDEYVAAYYDEAVAKHRKYADSDA